jgi:biotin carboxylase
MADSKDIKDLIRSAQEWHAQHHFDGVFTFAESSVVATAMIASELNLPGIGLDAAVKSRNKIFMRRAHKRGAAPHPIFRLVSTLDEALEAAGVVGFPAILKPTLGAGSQFVYKINSEEELREIYPKAFSGIQTMGSPGE